MEISINKSYAKKLLSVFLATLMILSCMSQGFTGFAATLENYYETMNRFTTDGNLTTNGNLTYGEVESVSAVAYKPIVEYTNGYWTQGYGPDSSYGGEYFHYYMPTLIYTIICKDGRVFTGSEYEIYEQTGSWPSEYSYQDFYTPWVVGQNTFTVEFLGVEGTGVVEIIEMPVASIDVEPVVWVENAGGWWIYDYNYETNEPYFNYSISTQDFDYTVTFKDGTIAKPNDDGFIEYNGYSYYWLDIDFDSYNGDELVLGENQLSVSMYELGGSGIATIELVESPVASVNVEPLVIIENTHRGYWQEYWNEETEEYESRYMYQIYPSDFEYTVTLKDGTVLEPDEDGYVYYRGKAYTIDSGEPFSCGRELDFGINEFTLPVLGYETPVTIEITDGPVESISAVANKPIIENTNGYWNYYWDYEIDEETQYFHYYLPDNIIYTVTCKDGTVFTGDRWDVYYEFGIEISDYSDQSSENQWGIGKHTFTIKAGRAECTAEIEIIENPIASISAVANKPIIEFTNGYYTFNDSGATEEYYCYELPSDVTYTVTCKDGTVFTGDEYDIYDEFEAWVSSYSDQSYENQWGIGKHTFNIEFLGIKGTAEVEIVETPVASITAEKISIIEQTFGYWEYDWNEDDEYFYYSFPNLMYTVTYKDGRVFTGDQWEIQEQTGYWISYDYPSQSYDNQLSIGKYEVSFEFLGVEGASVIEIVESPVDKIIVEPATIQEGTYGEWDWDGNYYYNASDIIEFKVLLKDGTTLYPNYGSYNNDGYYYENSVYVVYNGSNYYAEYEHNQYDSPWVSGNTYEVEFNVLGKSETTTITIVGEDEMSPYYYEEIDGGVVITGIKDNTIEKVEIPTEINGKPVVGIALIEAYNATEIIVPDSVQFVSSMWLIRCYNVEKITLGKSVGYIDANMFANANSLETIEISVENETYMSQDGVVYTKDGSTVVVYPLGKGSVYTVPAGVNNIDALLTNEMYFELSIIFDENSDEFVTIDGVTYTKDMTEVISCNLDKTGEYIMPDSVTKIASKAFAQSKLESVTLSKNLVEMVYNAFEECTLLTTVEIPEGVQSIGDGAFYLCESLNGVEIPESVQSIGESAFNGCASLETLDIPDSVQTIGDSAFARCQSLESIKLSNSITELPRATFIDCSSLTTITIPASVTSINVACFEYCTNLNTVNFDSVNSQTSLQNIAEYAFYQSGLTSISIPDSVTSLGYNAFEDCENLKDVKLPSNITSIPEECFKDSGLTSIDIPESVETIQNSAFAGCNNLLTVNASKNIKRIEYYAFSGTAFIESNENYEDGMLYIGSALYTTNNSLESDVVVKDGTVSIAPFAFEANNVITSLTLPEGVEYIGGYAFRSCQNLKTVKLPSTLKKIDGQAFENCSKLTDVNFPEGLEVIGWGAFQGTGIKSLKLPNTVTDIVYATFAGSDIEDIDMPDSVVSLGGHDFDGTPWEKAQPDGVVYADNVLYSYKGMMSENTKVDIKDGILSIGGYAFDGRKNLVEITFPEGLQEIGGWAFANCKGLTSLNFPSTLRTIKAGAFANCANIRDIYFGESLETIYGSAFRECTSITSINLPATVKDINVFAFSGCSSLEEINVDENNPYYSSIDGILYNKEGTKVIYCPPAKAGVITLEKNVTEIGDYAFAESKATKIIVKNDEVEIGNYAFATTASENRGGVNVILLCAQAGSTTEAYAKQYGQPFETCVFCEHITTKWIVDLEPTCTEPGSKHEECTDCGEKLATEEVSATGHNYGAWEIVVAPTCENAGSEKHTCSSCSDVETREVLALGHDYEVDFTVDEIVTWDGDAGWMSRHCTQCDATIDGRPIHDDTHTMSTEWEEYSFDHPIACSGTYILHCLDCDYAIKKQDTMHSREFLYEIPATCTTDGYGVMRCEVCWNELSERVIYPAIGHDWSDWEREEPTCTEDGYEGRGCLNLSCGELERIILPATGHDYATEYTVDLAPTCTAEGSKSQHCSRCESKTNVTAIPKLQHNLTWYTLSIPTCETDGVSHGYCNDCEYFEVKTVNKLGHDYASEYTVDLAPTCTAEGSKSQHCSRCESKANVTVIPATGHNYTSEITTPATHTATGVMTFTCACGNIYTETIDKLAEHTHNAIVTAPTCTEQGYTTYTCACGDTYVADYVNATGHTSSDWITDTAPTCTTDGSKHKECATCGETLETVVIEKIGHDYATEFTVDVEATATTDGSKSRHCKNCDAKTDVTIIPATGLNGWIKENGKWAYYENNVKIKNTWKQDSVGWCYLDSDGYMLVNEWAKDSKGWCYVGANGYCVTNQWVADSHGWCYLDADGRMATNKWVEDSKGWCYIGQNGYCVTSTWVKDSKGWCYLDADGRMATNKWVKDSKGWCYVGTNGYMVTNKWVKDSKGWCYIGADGYCLTNKWVADSKGWCYLDDNGRMVINDWVKDGNKWYYLDANGYMVTGTKKIGGKTYKFASNGVWIA